MWIGVQLLPSMTSQLNGCPDLFFYSFAQQSDMSHTDFTCASHGVIPIKTFYGHQFPFSHTKHTIRGTHTYLHIRLLDIGLQGNVQVPRVMTQSIYFLTAYINLAIERQDSVYTATIYSYTLESFCAVEIKKCAHWKTVITQVTWYRDVTICVTSKSVASHHHDQGIYEGK